MHFAVDDYTRRHATAKHRPAAVLWCTVRQRAISSLHNLARTLHVQHMYTTSALAVALPVESWDTHPCLCRRVRALTNNITRVASLRVVDKGQTLLFRFCHQWLWDETRQFLEHEGYIPQSLTHTQRIQSTLRSIITKNDWPVNPSWRIPLLYLLGKAKILLRGTVLWRPIAAVVEPQVQCFCLRTATRAFTLFL